MKSKQLTLPLLNQIKEGLINNQHKQRSCQNQSYQQYLFKNTELIHRELIENLILIAKNQVNTTALDNLAQNHAKYFSCLLAYCSQIVGVADTTDLFTISHKNFTSQSVLLALFLAKQRNQKVDLVIAQDALARSGHLIAGSAEEDKISFTNSALQKEGVTIHELNEWNFQGCEFKSNTVILDVFGINPLEYTPFLIKNAAQIFSRKAFVYHSHLQDDEVAHLLERVEKSAFPLQIWPQHPVQHIQKKQEKEIIEQLLQFLREDSNHPEKQDIVIFYPPEQHVKRFATRLHQQLSKGGVREQISLITKPHLKHQSSKNNIFLVDSVAELLQWNYDYSNVLYVIDYCHQALFIFDYSLETFIKKMGLISKLQKAKRKSIIGVNRIGRYVELSNLVTQTLPQSYRIKELSSYVVKMINYELFKLIDTSNQRINNCIRYMQSHQIISKDNNIYTITDERIITAAQKGIPPIQARLIYNILDNTNYNNEQKAKYANLVIMSLIVIHTSGNLRQAKQQIQAAAHIKPSGIWRKSGYIQSCLQILTKCELIEFRKKIPNQKSQSFRRKTSKFNEYQYDVFGSMFEIIQPKKKSFEEMQIFDLVREYTVNEDMLHNIRQKIDEYRQVFEIDEVKIMLQKQDVFTVISNYLEYNKNSLATYTGSRRNGYYIGNIKEGIFPSKLSLINLLNERPDLLAVFRLTEIDKKKQILVCNSLTQELYLEVFGSLPLKKCESLSEIEVEFHGISTSTFEKLWKNNGVQITKFETENDCFVEQNMEMAQITVHCSKEKADKIREEFEIVLAKIRQKLSVSSKLVHYLGNTNLVLGAGGAVKEIVKSDYINKCLLGNLHLEVTREDLEELFEDFVTTKDIVIRGVEPGKFFKSAVIHFHSQRDYYKFFDIFQECNYYDRLMEIKPIRDEEATNLAKPKQYIDFQWFVWKSHSKALIRFATSEGAEKALLAFDTNPLLDGAKVKVTLDDKNLTLEELSITTDEIYIEEALKIYGDIKEVEILKTPLKEISNEDVFLQNLIKNEKIDNLNFKLNPIEKKKNGLRLCRVFIDKINDMNQIANNLNKTIGKMGQSRLYAQTWFQVSILVPHGSMSIYQHLMDQTISKIPEKPNIQIIIQESNKKVYLTLKSGLKNTVDFIHQQFLLKLQGYPLDLTQYEKSILLTEIGMANILDLEDKYQCKLIVNAQTKLINVLINEESLKNIKQQVKARVAEHFFYRISLNSKAFKFFKSTPQKLVEIKTNYNLTIIQLEIDSKALLLESSAINVQNAFNYLMHFIESLTVPQQNMVNADVCGICCGEPHRPYRLQNCSHKFCTDCIMQYVGSALADASLFPLKCPHCLKEIVIDDLEFLLEAPQWIKVQTLSTNQYVTNHAQAMTFCFTPGCKQINMIKSENIECDVCNGNHCIHCKLPYHPTLTCQQAKEGGDELFKRYMKENGIRQCPNKNCKIPVVRIDGCYRVTCSRCNKSMCFKCTAEQMIAYDDYNLCYQHLNDVHGGYW